MRRIFYILLAFIVFTACEDDKEYIPSPLNETHWDLISAEISKYDSEGTLVLHRLDDYQNGTWDKAALRRLYFYGDNAIFYIKLSLTEDGSPTNRYQEKKYATALLKKTNCSESIPRKNRYVLSLKSVLWTRYAEVFRLFSIRSLHL